MAEKQQRKASKIPYFFFAFFAVVFAVDFTFIYFAEKTWRGVATDDSYNKGLRYNQTIEAVEEQKDLGWKIQFNFQSDGNKSGNFEVKIQDKNSRKITDAKLMVKLKRPTQDGFDFSQEMQFNNNAYSTKIDFPLVGQWDFEVVAVRDNQVFQEVKRYIVR